jgi:thioredoxin reductase (NADPH)
VYDEQTMESSVPGIYVAGTAVGGTQDKYTVFIENCHVHVERIVNALTGVAPPKAPEPLAQPES